MPQTVLNAQTGRTKGSAESRRLRRDGKIPGVVYGHGMEPLPVVVDRRELRGAVAGAAGFNTVLDLTVAVDGATKVYPAIIKELQRHPVRRNVTHIDFLQVNLDEAITVTVPVRLEGEAREVEMNNGLVDPAVDSIEVMTTPRSIPAEFVIDISEMTMETVIRLADVAMPEGVTATGDPEMAVVTVLVMRGADSAAEGETEAAADEGGEAADADAAE